MGRPMDDCIPRQFLDWTRRGSRRRLPTASRVQEAFSEVLDWSDRTPCVDLGYRNGSRVGNEVYGSTERNGDRGRPLW